MGKRRPDLAAMVPSGASSPPEAPASPAGALEAEPAPRRRPPIELGWILLGRFDPPDREAVLAARERMLDSLAETFPAFEWRMPLVERDAAATPDREEVVSLLDLGVLERQAKSWDFALVVTGIDLRSFYKPFALGAPSRMLAVAALSTNRVDPRSSGRGPQAGERVEVMTRRLYALGLHLFGHLAGLAHSDEPQELMYDVRAVSDLDGMEHFAEDQLEDLSQELAEVADVRLEERKVERRPKGRLGFYLKAAWHNRGALADAVRHAHPWQFPYRLSRLTTAALSALLVLMITAEAWDLGMSQDPRFVALLSLGTLLVTSGYLLRRQRLLVRREVARLTELTVVTNVSIVVTVLGGMATTYAGLFALTLAGARLFFRRHLIEGWAASLDRRVQPEHYFIFAAFVASLGLLIGALGASFEEHFYIRHVAYVDEET